MASRIRLISLLKKILPTTRIHWQMETATVAASLISTTVVSSSNSIKMALALVDISCPHRPRRRLCRSRQLTIRTQTTRRVIIRVAAVVRSLVMCSNRQPTILLSCPIHRPFLHSIFLPTTTTSTMPTAQIMDNKSLGNFLKSLYFIIL